MGIKTVQFFWFCISRFVSEKPPHHMGIKTGSPSPIDRRREPLKNLPTTWGLRHEFWVVFRQLQAL